MSEIKQIEPKNWATFLEEFSTRNNNRRARFDVYRGDGNTEEERIEAHFEDASLKENGDQHEVVIIRIDRSKTDVKILSRAGGGVAHAARRAAATTARVGSGSRNSISGEVSRVSSRTDREKREGDGRRRRQ